MNIALAGFGQEGKASYEYWNRDGNSITVADERSSIDGLSEGASTILGEGAFSKLGEFDLIIRSPSVNPSKLPYGEKVWSATNEFFKECPAEIIGVTGTKGKGTTSSLIASILQAAGKTVHLIGNIGTPALNELSNIKPDDIVVFELSSFQLWDIKKSPHIAVILNIEPEHLDIHDHYDDYVRAKSNIVKYQSDKDIAIYMSSTDGVSKKIAQTSAARKIPFMYESGSYIANNHFYYQKTEICSIDKLEIPGSHNLENACAAIACTFQYTTDKNAFERGISQFKGLPHRINFVREVKGVKYYDDSYSSAPAATIAAIKSFVEPKIIIVGGYDRQNSFSELAQVIKSTPSVKKVLLIGQTKNKLEQAFLDAEVDGNQFKVLDADQLADIVARAYELAMQGDVVILSPGCASFDMFKNFTDRGEQFIERVNAL